MWGRHRLLSYCLYFLSRETSGEEHSCPCLHLCFLSLFFSGNLRPPQLKSPRPPAHSGPWAAPLSVFASRLVNTLLQVLTERGRHFWRFGLGDLQASPLPRAAVRWVSPGAAPQRGGGCWKAGLCLDQQQEGGGHVHCPSEDTRKGS